MLIPDMSIEFPTIIGHTYSATMTQAGAIYAKAPDGSLTLLQEAGAGQQAIFQAISSTCVSTDEQAVVIPHNGKCGCEHTEREGGTGSTGGSTGTSLSQVDAAIRARVGSMSATGDNLHTPGGLAVDGTIDAGGGVMLPATLPSGSNMAASLASFEAARIRAWVGQVENCSPNDYPSLTSFYLTDRKFFGNATVAVSTTHHEPRLAFTLPAAEAGSLVAAEIRSTTSQYIIIFTESHYGMVAHKMRFEGLASAALLIGCTLYTYATTAENFSHPIHWHEQGADGRTAVTGICGEPHVTIYGSLYLGAARALVRVSGYNSGWYWYIVPDVTSYADVKAYRSHIGYINGRPMWRGMPEGGASYRYKAQLIARKNSASKVELYIQPQRLMVPMPVLGGVRQTNEGSGVLPMLRAEGEATAAPTVTADVTSIPAGGGVVTLTVTPAIAAALYILNDTMGSTAPWCTQSVDTLPAAGGTVTLTVAANEGSEARELWAFVGHEFGRAAVVKMVQAGAAE